jgi:hypothetical protein
MKAKLSHRKMKPHSVKRRPIRSAETETSACVNSLTGNVDVLRGAGAIADFLNEFIHPPISRMGVYKMVASGALPAGHLGAQIIGSKKRILAHLKGLLGGDA